MQHVVRTSKMSLKYQQTAQLEWIHLHSQHPECKPMAGSEVSYSHHFKLWFPSTVTSYFWGCRSLLPVTQLSMSEPRGMYLWAWPLLLSAVFRKFILDLCVASLFILVVGRSFTFVDQHGTWSVSFLMDTWVVFSIVCYGLCWYGCSWVHLLEMWRTPCVLNLVVKFGLVDGVFPQSWYRFILLLALNENLP